MTQDRAVPDRQSAYLETIRRMGRPQRNLGFIVCLLGVMMLVIARFRLAGAPWLLWGGVAVIAVGWGLFAYAVAARLLYVRAHPFDRKD